MADLFGQDEDAGEVMDDKAGTDLVFARDMDPGECHASDVYEEVECDQDLANYWNLYGVSPRAKSIHYNRNSSEFEQRCYALAEECLIFWTDTEASHFSIKVCTNEFKHKIALSR